MTVLFTLAAVELAREGAKPVAGFAKDLGISEPCLRNWMAQADADDNAVKLTSTGKRSWLGCAARTGSLRWKTRSSSAPLPISPGKASSQSNFRLVRELAGDGIPVAVACRVLKIFASGYYEWLGRPESPREARNRELVKLIAGIHEKSRGAYGWPRVHAELVPGPSEAVNRKRVARLMRRAGLQGIHRRKGRENLVNAATEEDLVHRQFTMADLDRR